MNDKRKYYLEILATILLIVAFVLFMLFFVKGESRVQIEPSESSNRTAVTCEKGNSLYQFFSYDNSKNKVLEINIILDNDDIESVSLTQELEYDSLDESKMSESQNRLVLNKAFGNDSLGVDALHANYYVSDKVMRLSLYADTSDLKKSLAKKYFLIDNGAKDLVSYMKNYESQGFSCEEKELK